MNEASQTFSMPRGEKADIHMTWKSELNGYMLIRILDDMGGRLVVSGVPGGAVVYDPENPDWAVTVPTSAFAKIARLLEAQGKGSA